MEFTKPDPLNDEMARVAFGMMMFPEKFDLKEDWWKLGPDEDPVEDRNEAERALYPRRTEED